MDFRTDASLIKSCMKKQVTVDIVPIAEEIEMDPIVNGVE
jgi:hypothetical protein